MTCLYENNYHIYRKPNDRKVNLKLNWIWSELLNYKKLLNIFYSWFTLKSIEEKNKISNKRFDGKKKIKFNSILFIV